MNIEQEQELQVWRPKCGVEYITAGKDFVDPPFDPNDIEYIKKKEWEIKVPNDRKLICIGGCLLAIPKSILRKQRMKNFLLKFFRGRNAK